MFNIKKSKTKQPKEEVIEVVEETIEEPEEPKKEKPKKVKKEFGCEFCKGEGIIGDPAIPPTNICVNCGGTGKV